MRILICQTQITHNAHVAAKTIRVLKFFNALNVVISDALKLLLLVAKVVFQTIALSVELI
jgi:hypothetical protein